MLSELADLRAGWPADLGNDRAQAGRVLSIALHEGDAQALVLLDHLEDLPGDHVVALGHGVRPRRQSRITAFACPGNAILVGMSLSLNQRRSAASSPGFSRPPTTCAL